VLLFLLALALVSIMEVLVSYPLLSLEVFDLGLTFELVIA